MSQNDRSRGRAGRPRPRPPGRSRPRPPSAAAEGPGPRGAARAGEAGGRGATRAGAATAGEASSSSSGRSGAEAGESEGLRINKALSGAGLGSRRAVEELVRAGRVAINGEVVREMGRRLDPARDRVEVDGSRVVLDQRLRYWMLNKPPGVVSTADDPRGRPTVVEMVPEEPRVYPVGRLDRDSEGLVLLTNDGELANRVTHPRYGVEKRYLAEVERLPTSAVARVQQGVELEDGPARAERARVVAGAGRRRMIEVVMVEGRKREVRRMLEAVGAPVRRLVRTAIGPLRLTGLAPGEYRALRPDEVRSLYRAAGP